MLGAIIGDIVGSIYEFNNIKTKEFEFWSKDAFFTDDTVMTCAIYRAIKEYKEKPSVNLEKEVVSWMQLLGRLYPDCSYGGNFSVWIRSNNPIPYGSYGNGSAMRVSAAGFLANTLVEAELLGEITAKVTHNHMYGIAGAVSVSKAIFLARSGCTKKYIKDILSKTWNLNFTLEEIRKNYSFNETCQGTVPEAIVCFLEGNNFEDTIRNAISIGGDSDTLAAIAGSIAEAYYGVPPAMKEKAYEYLDDYLKGLCQDFHKNKKIFL